MEEKLEFLELENLNRTTAAPQADAQSFLSKHEKIQMRPDAPKPEFVSTNNTPEGPTQFTS